MKQTITLEGYQLHLIPTKKFKNVAISVKLAAPLTKKESTIRTLLSFMLSGGTRKYPSTKLFSSYLEELYGAGFSSSIGTKGNAHVIHLFEVCIDEQYLPTKEQLLVKQIDLLHDIFYEPNVIEGSFNEQVLKQKKQELKWRLQSINDDKYTYSLEKMLEIMGENQPLGISTFGYEDEIDAITGKELFEYFQRCIYQDRIDIYVVGDIDDSIIDLFKKHLVLPKRTVQLESDIYFKTMHNGVVEKIEYQDIAQAKLNIGYNVETKFSDDDHYAMSVLNGVLGGFAHSLLFKTVRETHSLCYYINSSYDAFNGIMIINAGIETHNFNKTMALISEQIQNIQKGQFDDQLIKTTQIMLENAIIKSSDEAMSMIALSYNRDLTGKDESAQMYIEKLKSVQKEDIIKVSQKIKLDTVFLLAAKEES